MSMLTPITLKDIRLSAKIADFDNLSTVVSNMSVSISEMDRNILSNRTDIDETKIKINEYSSQIDSISSSIDISQKITEDRFTTKFEVLPTKAVISAGSASYLSVDEHIEHCLFQNMCKWKSSITYDAGQIVSLSTQTERKLYRAKHLLSAGEALTDTDSWEDITNNYYTEKTNENPISYHRYLVDVPAATKQYFEIKSTNDVSQQNVVIDWGDGSEKTYLNTATASAVTTDHDLGNGLSSSTTLSVKLPGEYDDHEINFYVSHDYANALTSDNTDGSQRFTITIVGSTYWGIRSNETYGAKKTDENIISRMWDLDLPFNDVCVNIASLCNSTNYRLLRLVMPSYFPVIYKLQNMTKAFMNCKNLQFAHGFGRYTWYQSIRAMTDMFNGCENMVKSDVRLPHLPAMHGSVVNDMYSNCKNLAVDLYDLIPVNGFSIRRINMSNTFNNCKSLQNVSNPNYVADMLWNDTSKKWVSTTTTFKECNSSLLKTLPNEWK